MCYFLSDIFCLPSNQEDPFLSQHLRSLPISGFLRTLLLFFLGYLKDLFSEHLMHRVWEGPEHSRYFFSTSTLNKRRNTNLAESNGPLVTAKAKMCFRALLTRLVTNCAPRKMCGVEEDSIPCCLRAADFQVEAEEGKWALNLQFLLLSVLGNFFLFCGKH